MARRRTDRRPLYVVVLAAGEGTRMRSRLPKPLHRLCGRPMLAWVLDALGDVSPDRTVIVVGHGAEAVTKTILELAPPALTVDFVEQRRLRGTGDAVGVALTGLPDDPDADEADLIVLPGDTPLLRPGTLAALLEQHRSGDVAATLLTSRLADPSGYGRVVRGPDGRVRRVVEHADADPDELAVDEVNTSIYAFRRALVAPALRRISPENAQGEYYLTDVVEVLAAAGHRVDAMACDDPGETAGVNDRAQLADAETELRRRLNHTWMRAGVRMIDPTSIYVDAGAVLAPDVTVLPGSLLAGRTVVGSGATVGPYTQLTDCVVGEDAVVAHTVARDSEIGPGAQVGPFAHLEPGTQVPAGARTGPFYTSATDEAPPAR